MRRTTYRALVCLALFGDDARQIPRARPGAVLDGDALAVAQACGQRGEVPELAHPVLVLGAHDLVAQLLEDIRDIALSAGQFVRFLCGRDLLIGLIMQIDAVDEPVQLADRADDLTVEGRIRECILQCGLLLLLLCDKVIDIAVAHDGLEAVLIRQPDDLHLEILLPGLVRVNAVFVGKAAAAGQMGFQVFGAQLFEKVRRGLRDDEMVVVVTDAGGIRAAPVGHLPDGGDGVVVLRAVDRDKGIVDQIAVIYRGIVHAEGIEHGLFSAERVEAGLQLFHHLQVVLQPADTGADAFEQLYGKLDAALCGIVQHDAARHHAVGQQRDDNDGLHARTGKQRVFLGPFAAVARTVIRHDRTVAVQSRKPVRHSGERQVLHRTAGGRNAVGAPAMCHVQHIV